MTKEKRREVYWATLFCLEDAEGFMTRMYGGVAGVCDILSIVSGINIKNDNDTGKGIETYFPEFAKQKKYSDNPDARFYWWNNDLKSWEKRKQAVLKAIALTYSHTRNRKR